MSEFQLAWCQGWTAMATRSLLCVYYDKFQIRNPSESRVRSIGAVDGRLGLGEGMGFTRK